MMDPALGFYIIYFECIFYKDLYNTKFLRQISLRLQAGLLMFISLK